MKKSLILKLVAAMLLAGSVGATSVAAMESMESVVQKVEEGGSEASGLILNDVEGFSFFCKKLCRIVAEMNKKIDLDDSVDKEYYNKLDKIYEKLKEINVKDSDEKLKEEYNLLFNVIETARRMPSKCIRAIFTKSESWDILNFLVGMLELEVIDKPKKYESLLYRIKLAGLTGNINFNMRDFLKHCNSNFNMRDNFLKYGNSNFNMRDNLLKYGRELLESGAVSENLRILLNRVESEKEKRMKKLQRFYAAMDDAEKFDVSVKTINELCRDKDDLEVDMLHVGDFYSCLEEVEGAKKSLKYRTEDFKDLLGKYENEEIWKLKLNWQLFKADKELIKHFGLDFKSRCLIFKISDNIQNAMRYYCSRTQIEYLTLLVEAYVEMAHDFIQRAEKNREKYDEEIGRVKKLEKKEKLRENSFNELRVVDSEVNNGLILNNELIDNVIERFPSIYESKVFIERYKINWCDDNFKCDFLEQIYKDLEKIDIKNSNSRLQGDYRLIRDIINKKKNMIEKNCCHWIEKSDLIFLKFAVEVLRLKVADKRNKYEGLLRQIELAGYNAIKLGSYDTNGDELKQVVDWGQKVIDTDRVPEDLKNWLCRIEFNEKKRVDWLKQIYAVVEDGKGKLNTDLIFKLYKAKEILEENDMRYFKIQDYGRYVEDARRFLENYSENKEQQYFKLHETGRHSEEVRRFLKNSSENKEQLDVATKYVVGTLSKEMLEIDAKLAKRLGANFKSRFWIFRDSRFIFSSLDGLESYFSSDPLARCDDEDINSISMALTYTEIMVKEYVKKGERFIEELNKHADRYERECERIKKLIGCEEEEELKKRVEELKKREEEELKKREEDLKKTEELKKKVEEELKREEEEKLKKEKEEKLKKEKEEELKKKEEELKKEKEEKLKKEKEEKLKKEKEEELKKEKVEELKKKGKAKLKKNRKIEEEAVNEKVLDLEDSETMSLLGNKNS